MQAIQSADPTIVRDPKQESILRDLIFDGKPLTRNKLRFSQTVSDALGSIIITIKPV